MQDSALLGSTIKAAGLDVSQKESILDKTKEFLRLLQMKLPIGSLHKAEACRHIIAIELSCRVLNIPFDKAKLMSLSTVSLKDYRKSLITCKTVLNLTWVVKAAVEILSVKYGLELKDSASLVLQQYKTNYYDKLGASQQKYINLESSLYQTASFYIVAKENKVMRPSSRPLLCCSLTAEHSC